MSVRIEVDSLKKQRESMYFWFDFVLKNDDIHAVLQRELLPGKNSGVWLLGHVVASDDDIGLYLGTHEIQFPDVAELFSSGKSYDPSAKYPETEYLLDCWRRVGERTLQAYDELTDADLDTPHARLGSKSVEEDFFGTKRNVLYHWTNHQLYHLGQLSTLPMQS